VLHLRRTVFEDHLVRVAAHREAVDEAVAQQHEGHGLLRDDGVDVVDLHIAHPHRREPQPEALRHAVRGADLHGLALAVVEPDALRIGHRQGDGGGAGVEHEGDRPAVDGALCHEMAAAVGRQHHAVAATAGAAPVADADGCVHAQVDALALELDHGLLGLQRHELHALVALADRHGLGRVAVHDQDRAAADGAGQGDRAGGVRHAGGRHQLCRGGSHQQPSGHRKRCHEARISRESC
jgi:hypothetical protein